MKVFIIRPYFSEIRFHVLGALSNLGVKIDEEWFCEAGTTPEEVIDLLHGSHPDFFLIPFHEGIDSEGRKIHGLKFAALLLETCPWVEDTPILLPVSEKDASSFEEAWKNFTELHTKHRVLYLGETEILGKGLPKKISDFVLKNSK